MGMHFFGVRECWSWWVSLGIWGFWWFGGEWGERGERGRERSGDDFYYERNIIYAFPFISFLRFVESESFWTALELSLVSWGCFFLDGWMEEVFGLSFVLLFARCGPN